VYIVFVTCSCTINGYAIWQCHAKDTPTRFKFEQDNQTKVEIQQKWKYKKTFNSSGQTDFWFVQGLVYTGFTVCIFRLDPSKIFYKMSMICQIVHAHIDL
jgi:hypothetical protein